MNFWDKFFRVRYWLIVFVAAFAALWQQAASLGLTPGPSLWATLAALSALFAVLWGLVSHLRTLQGRLRQQKTEIDSLQNRLAAAESRRSSCCIVSPESTACPLGVVAMRNKTEETLRSSLTEPDHSFKWLGLSAFNVVHNNQALFLQKKGVDYEFSIVSPANSRLVAKVDEYYMAPDADMNAGELIAQSTQILDRIAKSVHPKVRVRYHNQMPTFRIILIDDHKALVSFYERATNALESQQIEIVESPEAKYCIFKWFRMFYEKTLMTEEVNALARKP
jgi:hypothetical protein